MSAGGAAVPVVILVDTEAFAAVAASLAAVDGVEIDERMPAIGVISARVAPQRVAAVAGLDGVRSVEPERGFRIPPPDAEVQ